MTPIDRLFDPNSIVVIGASADPAKWGHQYAKALLQNRDRRTVRLVNARNATILGEPSFGSCADLPEAPEVAVICVPAAHALQSSMEAVSAGAKFIVVVTAGFAEQGEAGAAAQRQLVDTVRAAGARLVGPNCLGLFDADSQLDCTAFWRTHGGSVGLVSQSGTVLLELGARLADHGQGLSRAISIGNAADITASEYLDSFSHSASTQAVVIYLEQLRDARGLFASIDRLRNAGLPCVLLTPRASDATNRAVASHTGSLLTSDAAIDSAVADLGILRVSSVAAAVRAVRGLLAPARSKGSRVAVIADGGGPAVLGAGACVEAGLQVPAFSPELRKVIGDALQPNAGIGNPIDTVGALCLEDMANAARAVLASSEIDAVLLAGALNNLDRVTVDADRQTARDLLAFAQAHGKGLAVASMFPQEPAMAAFAAAGVPVSTDVVDAADMIAFGMDRPVRRTIPDIPPTQATATGDDYFAARRLFTSAGLRFPAAQEVEDVAAAVEAANAIGYPVVLKALGLLHKSDAGGVALALADDAALRAAVMDMVQRLDLSSFSVEAMVCGGVELILGGVRQPGVGPVVMIGIGGTLTELLSDTVAALAPVTPAYAKTMISRLKTFPLLLGYRGRDPVDLDAIAQALADLSVMFAFHGDIAECEVNPLLAMPSGAVSLDARIILVDEQ